MKEKFMKMALFLIFTPLSSFASSATFELETVDNQIVVVSEEKVMDAIKKREIQKKYKATELPYDNKGSILYKNPQIKIGDRYINLGMKEIHTVPYDLFPARTIQKQLDKAGQSFCDFIEQGEVLYTRRSIMPEGDLAFLDSDSKEVIAREAELRDDKIESVACKLKDNSQKWYFTSEGNSLFAM